MKFKKLFKSIAAITLAVCLSIPANAAAVTQSAPTLEEIAELNRINASKYAVSFIDEIFNSPGLQFGCVSEIYDEYDRVSGYCVDLVNGDDPSGYVIIDITTGQPVVMDFCIEPNARNPFDTISETFELPENDEFYYSFEPFDYHVFVPQNNILAGRDGKTELTQSFEIYKANVASTNVSECRNQNLSGSVDTNSNREYSYVDDVITATYEGKYVDSDWIYGADRMLFYSDYEITDLGYDYCCGIAFACNLMKYYHDARGMTKISDDLRILYPVLYSGAKAADGTAKVGNVVDSILVYLENVGYKYKYGTYWLKLFSDYRRDVKKDQPSMFNFSGWDLFQREVGHGVLVVGYLETEDYQYLIVADGWTSVPHFLNYSGSNFIGQSGGTFYAA